jgi:hypothetical protein
MGGGPGGWSGVATGCLHSTGPGLEIEVPKVTWCLSVRLTVDFGFRTSTDGQDQVLKSRSLDGRGGGGGRRMGGGGGWLEWRSHGLPSLVPLKFVLCTIPSLFAFTSRAGFKAKVNQSLHGYPHLLECCL